MICTREHARMFVWSERVSVCLTLCMPKGLPASFSVIIFSVQRRYTKHLTDIHQHGLQIGLERQEGTALRRFPGPSSLHQVGPVWLTPVFNVSKVAASNQFVGETLVKTTHSLFSL